MIAYDDIVYGRGHQSEMAVCGGVPIEWLHQIDRACDCFFASRGMRGPLPLKELIHLQAVARQRCKTLRQKRPL